MRASISLTHNLDFTRAKKFVNSSVRHAILMEGINLSGYIRERKLTGQVLNVQTGRLRNSIQSRFKEKATEWTSTVSTNVKYAGAHEYGFKGAVTVRSHKRRIKSAFGKPIPTKEIMIGSFTRQMNLPERSYMRSSLNENERRILNAISKAVDDGLEFL